MASKALRALMKDRQLAKRIQHQFAKYDSLGRLTCTICNGLVVKSEALWPSHLTSKPHRTNFQRHQVIVSSHPEALPPTRPLPKRKPDDPSEDDVTEAGPHQDKKVRFKAPSPSHEPENVSTTPNNALPSDFFDDPAQMPAPGSRQDDQEQGEDDPEWEAFQAALEAPPPEDTSANLFAQASTIAEPVLYSSNQSSGQENLEEGLPDDLASMTVDQEDEAPEEDPIEKRIREEHEEIMDRIQNEEREQMEADQRVLRMKARVNAFRASRKKSSKSTMA